MKFFSEYVKLLVIISNNCLQMFINEHVNKWVFPLNDNYASLKYNL